MKRGRKKSSFDPVGMRFGSNIVLKQLGINEYEVACDCGNIRPLKGCTEARMKRLKGCVNCWKDKFYPRVMQKRTNRIHLFFTDQHFDALYHIAYRGGYKNVSELCRRLVIKSLTQQSA